MPKHSITIERDLKTRNDYTKVDAVLTISVDGREIPTAGLLGECLEKAWSEIQAAVTESYNTIPARI